LRAFLHLRIVLKSLAIDGTPLTDLGTGTASKTMQRRIADHKVGAGLADFCTVEQQANVRCLGVLASLVQTVHRRFQADAVTI
jgi:hypothetical protein